MSFGPLSVVRFLSPLLVSLLVCSCSGNERTSQLTDVNERPRTDAEPEVDATERLDVPESDAPESDVFEEENRGDAEDGSSAPDTDVPDTSAVIDQVIVVDGAAALPDLFAGATEAEGGPSVVYPVDMTTVPRNVSPPLFQWEGPSNSAYRVRFTAPGLGLDVFTTDWSWQPSQFEWDGIVTAAMGQDIQMQVTQLGANAQVGAPSVLHISNAVVEGAVYYWAPSQSAIVRLPIGSDTPEPFITGTAFSCAGCHALSPDGTRVAYTRGGGTPIGPMGVRSTDRSARQIQPESLNGYYPSFGPDNVSLAVARGGDIVIIDTDTGDDVATLHKPEGRSASHPAYSPRSHTVVYAAGVAAGGSGGGLEALSVSNAGLVRVARTGTTWGEPQWLVEPGEAGGPGENLFYPAFSPDGNWVAFNRAMSAAGAGSSPANSELWMVSSNPNAAWGAVRLSRAQGPDGTTNSWPKWAPGGGDGRLWLAFTSNRPYGRIETGGSQIWIASVSINDAFLGVDPSSSAYWMPHQELGTSNHVAYWAPYRKDDEPLP